MRDDYTVIKHTRVETTETRAGRLRTRTVTTWDVVRAGGVLVSEHHTQREAFAARYTLRQLAAIPLALFNNRHED